MNELEMLLEERKKLNERINAARAKERRSKISSRLITLKKVRYGTGRVDWKLVIPSIQDNFDAANIVYRNVHVTLDAWHETNERAIAYLKEIAESINSLIDEAEKGTSEESNP